MYCHSVIKPWKGEYINFINIEIPAILGTTEKKLVTEVGDPWYTSGVHMWKGTAEILKAKPTRMKTIPKIVPALKSLLTIAICSKFVDPEKPYIKEHPYNNRPDESALKTKYFIPASDDLMLSLSIDAKI